MAVVDGDQKFRTRLAMHLGQGRRAASFPTLEALREKLPAGASAVVVLGRTFADAGGLTQIEALLKERPHAAVVLVVPKLTTEVLQRALRAGVRDVLSSPAEPPEVAAAVDRIAEGLSARLPARRSDSGDEPLGQVVTVFSTKGGSGKSVIATNLALLLARKAEGPVVLVDADLQFGDISIMLKLTPQHTIVDVVGSLDRLDTDLLKQLLVSHEATGLLVLPAPLEPAFADQVDAGQMTKIVDLLRDFAAYVVIDTPAYFNEVVLNLLEVSDDILLVAGMDLPNIKNVKIGLQTLRLLNIPAQKLRLILNRANSKVMLDVNEVERTLQLKADALIPSDIVVPQAVNKGVPVVLEAPRSGVSRSLEQLADLILSGDEARRRR